MDTGACCVAPSATPRSDDQIVPAHPGDCWNPHQSNHSQPFVDAWLLQMQVNLRKIATK
ncbi:hypothetical protein TcasGA2_TC032607 [Tribolium castaneum]|uniref:Uncharacterized protein n=1 Tax=Tribolium castaneum TaxID=7070 RepID=A0A139WK38_TRICA|nr:hypothetical protein TcasGA2_TC032607 [Tribolium castaneum]